MRGFVKLQGLAGGPTGTLDQQPDPRPTEARDAIRLCAKNGSVYLHRVFDISEHIQNSTLTAATKSGGLRLSLGGRRTLFKHFVDEAERLRFVRRIEFVAVHRLFDLFKRPTGVFRIKDRKSTRLNSSH